MSHAHARGALSDGHFVHHGAWAPGVRLFRQLGFRSKALTVSLCFQLPLAIVGHAWFHAEVGDMPSPARWRDGLVIAEHAPEIDSLDFDGAIEAHRAWKVKLHTAIDHKVQLDAARICRDDPGPLGQWLHGPGGARWSSQPGFVTRLDAHAGFPRAAGEVAETINRGAYDRAGNLLGSGSAFAKASSETVTAILRAKRGF